MSIEYLFKSSINCSLSSKILPIPKYATANSPSMFLLLSQLLFSYIFSMFNPIPFQPLGGIYFSPPPKEF